MWRNLRERFNRFCRRNERKEEEEESSSTQGSQHQDPSNAAAAAPTSGVTINIEEHKAPTTTDLPLSGQVSPVQAAATTSGNTTQIANVSGDSQAPIITGSSTDSSTAKSVRSEKLLRELSSHIGVKIGPLSTELGFSHAQLEGFQHDNQQLEDQNFAMLDEWNQKQSDPNKAPGKLSEAFCAIGRHDLGRLITEHNDVANSSTGQPSLAQSLTAAGRCAKELKALYSEEGNFIQINPFDNRDQKEQSDIFTKLELVEDSNKKSELVSNKKSKSKRETLDARERSMLFSDMSESKRETKDATVKPISVEEIFTAKTKNGKVIKRAILNGLAGMGKTTLMAKVAYDWACGTALKQFKLVFSLNMSQLNQYSDLIEAIHDQLLADDTHVNRDDLESFIQHNQDEVLILLDGFDESQTTSISGYILKILNRKMLKDCWVVVTTRPSHFDQLVTEPLIQEPYTHVRVLGFNEEEISEYVHKFYSEEQDQKKVDWLLDVITESSILSDLATSPMLLLLFCLLWRKHSTLPETLWDIYNEAVNYIFGRKGMDEDEIFQIVIELGKVALRGLLSPGQSLSFKKTDFDEDTSDKAIKAGILTRQRVLKKGLRPQDEIQFLHKTIQAFCAGEFFKNLFLTNKTEYEETLLSFSYSFREDARSLEHLLRFCCGNSKHHVTNDILKIYHNSLVFDRKLVQKSVFACYSECQIKSLPPSEVVGMIIKPEICIECHTDDMVVSFNRFVKYLEQTDKGKNYLGKVREVTVTGVGRSADMNLIFDSLSCMNNLVELDLSLNDKLGVTAASWAHHLKQVKQLQRLCLSGCGLIGEDMNHICDSLSCMNNLVELELSFNDKLGGTAASWARHLKQVKQLHTLKMSRCGLIDEDMNPICDSLSCMNNLVEFELRFNAKLGGTAASWARHLKQVKQLHRLVMCRCGLIGEDMNHIFDSLSCMNNLVLLDLGDNDKLGGTAASWARHLKQVKQLQRLVMWECGLTADDQSHLNGGFKLYSSSTY